MLIETGRYRLRLTAADLFLTNPLRDFYQRRLELAYVLIIGPLKAIYCNDKFPLGSIAEYFESVTAIIRSISWG